MSRARRRRTADLTAVAAVTQRLAVLLGAGVTPASAWEHAAASTGSATAASVVQSARPVPDALMAAAAGAPRLEADAWHGLAAAWSVASDAGAPLAAALKDYAASLRSLAQTRRDAAVALAAPVATARLVMGLPIVALLFGATLGFDTIATLFATPVGWSCLALGVVLLVAAALWNRRLVARATPHTATPGLEFDLMAIAVSGGSSLDRARAICSEALDRFALQASLDRTAEVLGLSHRAGVPAAELLRSEADEQRRVARADAEQKAAALSVQLMLPLGLCVLPAFVMLGVMPLLIAVIGSTVAGF